MAFSKTVGVLSTLYLDIFEFSTQGVGDNGVAVVDSSSPVMGGS
jgi:hypothetical protein